MIRTRWRNLTEGVTNIGEELRDPDLHTQKTVINFLSLSAIPIGVTWGLIEYAVGEPINALITGVVAVLVLINFLLYHYRGNFYRYRLSQLIVFLSFPFILHLSVGGFTRSANLFWGLATPLIALLSSRPKEGTPWFVAFLGLVSLSGVIDPLIFPENKLSAAETFFEFSFNIINVSLIVYLMILYFVRQKNRAYTLLEAEKKQSERLLLNVLPREIAQVLKSGKEPIADHFDSATILFADIVDFTRLSMRMSPDEMVELLNHVFSYFDSLVEKYGVEKIRTIGDNYMVASGLPRPKIDHAHCMASMALDMASFIGALQPRNGSKIDFRIGINSGPVVAGVIGKRKFQYDIWGDVVNTASRMESHGVAGKIQITPSTYALIKKEFSCQPRGSIAIKGKGEMDTWFLEGRRS